MRATADGYIPKSFRELNRPNEDGVEHMELLIGWEIGLAGQDCERSCARCTAHDIYQFRY